jgi:hypothetical protein
VRDERLLIEMTLFSTTPFVRIYLLQLTGISLDYGILVGKPEGKRPVRRYRRRCVDNIEIDGKG